MGPWGRHGAGPWVHGGDCGHALRTQAADLSISAQHLCHDERTCVPRALPGHSVAIVIPATEARFFTEKSSRKLCGVLPGTSRNSVLRSSNNIFGKTRSPQPSSTGLSSPHLPIRAHLPKSDFRGGYLGRKSKPCQLLLPIVSRARETVQEFPRSGQAFRPSTFRTKLSTQKTRHGRVLKGWTSEAQVMG